MVQPAENGQRESSAACISYSPECRVRGPTRSHRLTSGFPRQCRTGRLNDITRLRAHIQKNSRALFTGRHVFARHPRSADATVPEWSRIRVAVQAPSEIGAPRRTRYVEATS